MALLALALVIGLTPACTRAAPPPEDGVMDALAVRALAAEGKPVLASLWATWCEPCLDEMAPLSAFQAAHPEVVVLGLSTDDPSATGMRRRIDKVLSERRPTYRQARLRPGGEMAFLTHFVGAWDGMLPKLVVVLPDGRAKIHSGAVDADELRTMVTPWLSGAF